MLFHVVLWDGLPLSVGDYGKEIFPSQQRVGMFFMTIGERLRDERDRLGMSQPKFAAIANTTKQTLFSWEKGMSSPTAVQLAALAEAGVDVLFVLTGKHVGDVEPAPTLTAEEETLLSYYREASKEVRRAALGALLGASGAAAGQVFNAPITGGVAGRNIVNKGRK